MYALAVRLLHTKDRALKVMATGRLHQAVPDGCRHLVLITQLLERDRVGRLCLRQGLCVTQQVNK
jgi:hypothetical protein